MVSESIWLRLGQGMSRCISFLTEILREGTNTGAFTIDDPDYVANVLWAQVLGTMHLARVGAGMRQVGPGVPDLFPIAPERVVQTCVDSALATAGGRAGQA
jgi:hypothetical protein